MWVENDTLPAAVENLEQALGGDGEVGSRVWAARVDQALFSIQQAIRGYSAVIEATADGRIDLGSAQAPSPGLDRRAERLGNELADLLDEAAALRGLVRQVLQGSHYCAPGRRTFDGFRSRLGDLLDGLANCEHEEARIILETAATDIGAGD